MRALLNPHTNTHVLREALQRLQEAGITSASLDARLLLQHVLCCTREQLLLAMDQPISTRDAAHYARLIARRSNHEPVAYLTGRREFFGLEFATTPATLIPRPDSETLIEAVLSLRPDRAQSLRIMDVGTGTGCLLLALLHAFPQARGVGVDINPDAVALARANARHLGLDARASFTQGSWLDGVSGTFDLIISNPPYIPTADMAGLMPEVARYEPARALDGGADGLDCYRTLLPQAAALLARNGLLVFEVGIAQAEAVRALGLAQGFTHCTLHADLAGIPRALIFSHSPEGTRS